MPASIAKKKKCFFIILIINYLFFCSIGVVCNNLPNTNFFQTTTPRYDFLLAANHCRIFYFNFSTTSFFNFYCDFSFIPQKIKVEMDIILTIHRGCGKPALKIRTTTQDHSSLDCSYFNSISAEIFHISMYMQNKS
jgi:hypothetical protein